MTHAEALRIALESMGMREVRYSEEERFMDANQTLLEMLAAEEKYERDNACGEIDDYNP